MLIFLYCIFSVLRSCLVVIVYVDCDDSFLTFFFNKKRILSILSPLLGGRERDVDVSNGVHSSK